MTNDGALLVPSATSDAAAAEPARRTLNADGNASAQAATDDAHADGNWGEEKHATDWEHPGMPVVMIPRDNTAEGSSSQHRFEGLAYSCEECGFHFDLHFKPMKSFLTWLKTKVEEMNFVEILLVTLLPPCLVVSLILAWLQAVSFVQHMSWALAVTFGLLMAMHTGFWLRVGLAAVRSKWKAYRDWEPQCDPSLIARLVDILAREQAGAMARTEATAHEAQAEGEPGGTEPPPMPQS